MKEKKRMWEGEERKKREKWPSMATAAATEVARLVLI